MTNVKDWPTPNIIADLRNTYKPGTKVKLLSMSDPYENIPVGTQGTVIAVDDLGTIHVNWDNGSSLGIVYCQDACAIIS